MLPQRKYTLHYESAVEGVDAEIWLDVWTSADAAGAICEAINLLVQMGVDRNRWRLVSVERSHEER